ncbi:MAG: hypothetical protein IJK79_05555 [Bacteroidales bacterium]|nr:hypothetical protein [Bacteroidales bacterium]
MIVIMRNVFLLVSFFLFISCTSDLDQMINGSLPVASDTKAVFYATTEGGVTSLSGTKTYADSQMRVLWNEGDQISIFNKITYNQGFEFDGEDGDTAGGFYPFTQLPSFGSWGDLAYVYAVYPYSTKNKSDYDGNLTVILPSEQSYKENSFGIGANTMVAVTETSRIQFKNVGGYLSLRLYGDNVKVSRVTIKGNNNEKIAGKAKVTIPLGGTPTTVMDNTATDEISIVCDPPVQLGADAEHYTDFWFVIPPVTFSGGFTITVTDEMGGTFVKSTSRSFTVYRNQLDWMNPLDVVPSYYVVFDDAVFEAYCIGEFDDNRDGKISLEEASEVEQVDVYCRNVESLKGIECFSNLKKLRCGWNQLTSLDVSHNTALTELTCDNNQLKSLDVSNNTALQVFACFSNQLKSLDVTHNTALTYFTCGWNQLTNIDVSNNTLLTTFGCDMNPLGSLDVSHNTALTFLGCYGNGLNGLDVSHNTALQELVCFSNQLTNLDVSSNTELTRLECNDNLLTSLDVSNNAKLATLWCMNNPMLTEIWILSGQSFTDFQYDTDVATVLYKNTAPGGIEGYTNQDYYVW